MGEGIERWRAHWLIAGTVRLGSGAMLVAAANVSSTLSLFLISVAVGRLAGAANLGRYGLMVVVGSFFGGIVDLGTDRVLTERLAQHRPSWISSFWSVICLKGFALGLGLVAGVVAFALNRSPYVLLVAIQALALTSMLTTQAMAAALQRLRALALVRFLTRCAAVLAVGTFALETFGAPDLLVTVSIIAVAAADIGCSALLGALVFAPEMKALDREPANSTTVRLAIREALPLGASSIAVWLYVKLDTIILAVISDLPTLGIYTAAVRLAEALGGIPTALHSVVLPTLARFWARDLQQFQMMRDTVLAITTTGLGFVSLVTFLLAEPLVGLTYRLPDAALYLKILVWGQVFAAAGVVLNSALQVSGRSSAVAKIAIIVAITSIPVYVVLISRFGGLGAAIATSGLYFAILPIGLALPTSRETFRPLVTDTTIVAGGLGGAFAILAIINLRGPAPLGAQIVATSLAYISVAVVGLSLTARHMRRSEARP